MNVCSLVFMSQWNCSKILKQQSMDRTQYISGQKNDKNASLIAMCGAHVFVYFSKLWRWGQQRRVSFVLVICSIVANAVRAPIACAVPFPSPCHAKQIARAMYRSIENCLSIPSDWINTVSIRILWQCQSCCCGCSSQFSSLNFQSDFSVLLSWTFSWASKCICKCAMLQAVPFNVFVSYFCWLGAQKKSYNYRIQWKQEEKIVMRNHRKAHADCSRIRKIPTHGYAGTINNNDAKEKETIFFFFPL